MIHVVKRRGHKQEYDERKVYASVYAACMNVHRSHEKAEEDAKKVVEKISEWIKERQEVTSNEIFIKTADVLREVDEDAAFMYSTHRDIS